MNLKVSRYSFCFSCADLWSVFALEKFHSCVLVLGPPEVKCEFLKSSFFVVAVFLWSNRVIIRINMHREATRNLHMVPWGWGEGRFFFLSLILYEKNISI